MDTVKQYYTTVFAQSFSPCGRYLAAGCKSGLIAVFGLSPFLNADDACHPEESHKYPVYKFQAHNSPIYALITTGNFLISGATGEIYGWNWADVKKREAKPIWALSLLQGENFSKPEVNALCCSARNEKLFVYAGCGDSLIHCWDVESAKEILVFSGHSDYIHCLALSGTGQECYSGSEDGTLRIWDTRRGGHAVGIVEPHKQEELNRPRLGKWIGCIALDASDDWLVCGGGPVLCVWHLRSLSPSTTFSKHLAPTVAMFHDDTIICAGSQPSFQHWTFGGELKADVPTSASSVYSIATSIRNEHKVLSAAGTSYKIDICTNFMYRDFSLVIS